MLPNLLSGARLLAALFFCIQEPWIRILLVCVAALTDYLDGYFARVWGQQSRLGVVLDPLADKIFVLMGVWCFWIEGRLSGVAACLFFAREWVLLWFMGYLLLKGKWGQFAFRSVWNGKAITTLQFAFLFVLSAGYTVSTLWPVAFIPLALSMGVALWRAAQQTSFGETCSPNERGQH